MMTTARPIRVPDHVTERIRGMHPELKRKVRDSLKIILDNPYEGKALKDELSGPRSLRVGRFRIIYRLDQTVVEIVAIGPRERIYEDTYRLMKKTGEL